MLPDLMVQIPPRIYHKLDISAWERRRGRSLEGHQVRHYLIARYEFCGMVMVGWLRVWPHDDQV